MHDRQNPPTLVAVDPPTLPASDLRPPPSVEPPTFPAPRRSTGGRFARILRRWRDRRG